MYVVGFVIPMPEGKLEAYRDWSARTAELLTEYGCLEIVEAWEDNVPIGTHTDFRPAVDAKPDEKIVFSWQKWPDKASVDAVKKVMSEGPRFDPPLEIPFDQKRLITGASSRSYPHSPI